jgi:hypothetical protein
MRLAAVVGVGCALLFSLESGSAYAQSIRRRFEPTDLKMKRVGTAEIDIQIGFVQGALGHRIVAPDIEASLGLTSFAQLQIDTSFGFDDGTNDDFAGVAPRTAPTKAFQFLENTWAALKLGIVDRIDPVTKRGWVFGVQAGPKLATTSWSRGTGLEALAIVGRSGGSLHLFAQGGVLLDPYFLDATGSRFRPFAVEGGLDLDLDLDSVDKWSFRAELGGAHFFAPKFDQIHLTAGISYRIVRWLELSAIGIAGLGPGDRLGGLLGATPRFDLF